MMMVIIMIMMVVVVVAVVVVLVVVAVIVTTVVFVVAIMVMIVTTVKTMMVTLMHKIQSVVLMKVVTMIMMMIVILITIAIHHSGLFPSSAGRSPQPEFPFCLCYAVAHHVAPRCRTILSLQPRFGIPTGLTSFAICHSVLLIVLYSLSQELCRAHFRFAFVVSVFGHVGHFGSLSNDGVSDCIFSCDFWHFFSSILSITRFKFRYHFSCHRLSLESLFNGWYEDFPLTDES